MFTALHVTIAGGSMGGLAVTPQVCRSCTDACWTYYAQSTGTAGDVAGGGALGSALHRGAESARLHRRYMQLRMLQCLSCVYGVCTNALVGKRLLQLPHGLGLP